MLAPPRRTLPRLLVAGVAGVRVANAVPADGSPRRGLCWAAVCVGDIVLNAIRPNDNHRLRYPIETAFGSKTRQALT